MYGYIKPDFVPEDKYQKARKDFMQAFASFSKLNPQEKQALLNEMYQYAAFQSFLDQYNNNGMR